MSKKVHILNGDSTASFIKESGLSGDHIIFRELFCEGPISEHIGSDDFWTLRYAFFEDELEVSRLDYYDKVIKEFLKIENLSQHDEVTLWFEYDLFCQVNLMAACAYLLNFYRKDLRYYLVCVGNEKHKESLHTLSDYSPQEYMGLYENRVKLTRHDLVFASECWKTYTTNDLRQIQTFDFGKNRKFKYFQLAMMQHLKRFVDGSGFNQIDLKILETIHNNKYNKQEIIRELLRWQKKETVYGFGDLQYVKYLEKLHPFYEIKNDKYYLNPKGGKIRASAN